MIYANDGNIISTVHINNNNQSSPNHNHSNSKLTLTLAPNIINNNSRQSNNPS